MVNGQQKHQCPTKKAQITQVHCVLLPPIFTSFLEEEHENVKVHRIRDSVDVISSLQTMMASSGLYEI